MNSFAKVQSSRILIFLSFILFTHACTKKESTSNGTSTQWVDKCAGVECKNGGSCVDGVCECVDGYEGENCEVLSREKYLGTYVGYCRYISRDSFEGTLATVTIVENVDETKVEIKGLIEGGSVVDVAFCTALSYKFYFYTTVYPYYQSMSGRFVDGDSNKLKIDWRTPYGSHYIFEGERQ